MQIESWGAPVDDAGRAGLWTAWRGSRFMGLAAAMLLAACQNDSSPQESASDSSGVASDVADSVDDAASAADKTGDTPDTPSDSQEDSTSTDRTQEPEKEDPVMELRKHVAELNEKAEKDGVQLVEVQHLLVSFAGTGTRATRTKSEAEALAGDLWQQIQDGADFEALIREHTDDSPPGIYTMVDGVAPGPGQYPRRGMVAAFGNVGWRLDVGEFGVAGFDADTSPYGWHIIKRLR